ncbi:MAG: flippase-like domain-containing protein [Caldilineales bacterium]|nr:flippase-like domain-containing protein [Caldilineales bacterium]
MSKTLKNLLKIGFSLVLLLFLLSRIDTEAVGAILAEANPWGLAATFLLFAGGIILRAIRWQILLSGLGEHVGLGFLTRWYYIGAFFNTILPTGFGGDVVKSIAVAGRTDQASNAVGSVFLDRYLGIVVLLGMGVIMLPFSGVSLSPWLTLALILLFLALVAVFWVLRQERLWRWIYQTLLKITPARLHRFLAAPVWLKPFYTALQQFSARSLMLAIAASLVFNLSWILTNMAAGWALGIDVPAGVYFVFVPIASLALLLPTFGGIGARELSYVGLFTQVGVPAESAFALSLVIYAATVATGLLGGIIYLIQNMQGGKQPLADESVLNERP